MRVISFSFYFLFSFEVHATITKWPVKRCDGPPEFRKYKCITSRHCPGLCRNDPKQVCFLSVHCKGRDNSCEGKKCGIEPSHTPSEAPSDMTSSAPSDVPKQEFAKADLGYCLDKNNEQFTTNKGTQVAANTNTLVLKNVEILRNILLFLDVNFHFMMGVMCLILKALKLLQFLEIAVRNFVGFLIKIILMFYQYHL